MKQRRLTHLLHLLHLYPQIPNHSMGKIIGAVSMLLLLVLASGDLHSLPSQPKQPRLSKHGHSHTSAVFSITGNVYPDGYYYATVMIGDPPRQYFLDIDTGSNLTWVQYDTPCKKCTKCDYEVKYADSGSSVGVLVRDSFSMRFTNGSVLSPKLVFGCSYERQAPNSTALSAIDGVLGLGGGEMSIVSQLSRLGIIRNIVGHCLGDRGGFLFFGEDPVPPRGITWVPLLGSAQKYYSVGGAELFLGGQTTGVKSLDVIFDSGSSYTYLNWQAYAALLSLVEKKARYGKEGMERVDDEALPICWKGSKHLNSFVDLRPFFLPISLRFAHSKPAVIHMHPRSYLIVTVDGNVCLGVLNGTEAGLGQLNIIGDNCMKGKMVIYDNERMRMGWAEVNCDNYRKKM